MKMEIFTQIYLSQQLFKCSLITSFVIELFIKILSSHYRLKLQLIINIRLSHNPLCTAIQLCPNPHQPTIQLPSFQQENSISQKKDFNTHNSIKNQRNFSVTQKSTTAERKKANNEIFHNQQIIMKQTHFAQTNPGQ